MPGPTPIPIYLPVILHEGRVVYALHTRTGDLVSFWRKGRVPKGQSRFSETPSVIRPGLVRDCPVYSLKLGDGRRRTTTRNQVICAAWALFWKGEK